MNGQELKAALLKRGFTPQPLESEHESGWFMDYTPKGASAHAPAMLRALVRVDHRSSKLLQYDRVRPFWGLSVVVDPPDWGCLASTVLTFLPGEEDEVLRVVTKILRRGVIARDLVPPRLDWMTDWHLIGALAGMGFRYRDLVNGWRMVCDVEVDGRRLGVMEVSRGSSGRLRLWASERREDARSYDYVCDGPEDALLYVIVGLWGMGASAEALAKARTLYRQLQAETSARAAAREEEAR